MKKTTLYFWLVNIAVWTVMLFVSGTQPVYAAVSQQQINAGLCSGSNFDFTGNSAYTCSNSTGSSITNLVHIIINLLSVVVGLVAVIMIIVGGLRYITSGGSDTSVTGAKNTILYAIIGLIIVAFAQIMVRFILSKVAQT